MPSVTGITGVTGVEKAAWGVGMAYRNTGHPMAGTKWEKSIWKDGLEDTDEKLHLLVIRLA